MLYDYYNLSIDRFLKLNKNLNSLHEFKKMLSHFSLLHYIFNKNFNIKDEIVGLTHSIDLRLELNSYDTIARFDNSLKDRARAFRNLEYNFIINFLYRAVNKNQLFDFYFNYDNLLLLINILKFKPVFIVSDSLFKVFTKRKSKGIKIVEKGFRDGEPSELTSFYFMEESLLIDKNKNHIYICRFPDFWFKSIEDFFILDLDTFKFTETNIKYSEKLSELSTDSNNNSISCKFENEFQVSLLQSTNLYLGRSSNKSDLNFTNIITGKEICENKYNFIEF